MECAHSLLLTLSASHRGTTTIIRKYHAINTLQHFQTSNYGTHGGDGHGVSFKNLCDVGLRTNDAPSMNYSFLLLSVIPIFTVLVSPSFGESDAAEQPSANPADETPAVMRENTRLTGAGLVFAALSVAFGLVGTSQDALWITAE
jgi:hypothetical protein